MNNIDGKSISDKDLTIVGESIAKFIAGVSITEANIGNMEIDRSNMKLVTVGKSIMERKFDDGVILKPWDDKALKMPKVFNYGTRVQMVKYLNTCNTFSDEEKKALKDRIDNLMSCKEVIIPFKARTRIKVSTIVGDNKISAECNILRLDVRVDLETGTYSGTVITDYSVKDRKFKMSFEEYNKAFKLCDMEVLHTKTADVKDCIEMSEFGYIKPVEFVVETDKNHGRLSVIVDNSSLYYATDTEIKFMCKLEDYKNLGNECVSNVIKDKKLLKALAANVEYIRRHGRNVAAIGMCDTKQVIL